MARSTRQRPTRRPARGESAESADDRTIKAEVRAVEEHLDKLRRAYPTISPREVIDRLYDFEPGVGKVPPWRYHLEILKHEPSREAFRKSKTAYNRRIVSLMNRLAKTSVLGGPIKCQECGAGKAAERTVWCVSDCLSTTDGLGRKATDSLGRKARIREELRRGLLLPGTKFWQIPKRGPRSRLGWLPERAAPLAEYFGLLTGRKADSLPVCEIVAGLLTVASGENITAQMVKDRVLRHADPRHKYKS